MIGKSSLWITIIGFVLFIAIIAVPASAAAGNIISPGDTVFIGEQNLNIASALGSATKIAWFKPGANHSSDWPDSRDIITIDDPLSFYVINGTFKDRTGDWYQWFGAAPAGDVVFRVEIPTLDVLIMDKSGDIDVTDDEVTMGTTLNFRIETNLDQLAKRSGSNGFINLIVYDPGGARYTQLYGQNKSIIIGLTNLTVNKSPYYWTPIDKPLYGWNTGVVDDITKKTYYQMGIYEVSAVCNANHLDVKSTTKTVNLKLDVLTLSLSSQSITRGNPFYATIRGLPSTDFVIWVKECPLKMTGSPCDQPPLIQRINQYEVHFDPEGGPYLIGNTPFNCANCINMTVRKSVPPIPFDGTRYYAQSRTYLVCDPEGKNCEYKQTIRFDTDTDTKDKIYTIRIQRMNTDNTTEIYAEKEISVNKGIVTMEMNSSAYLGEGITIKGTNTDSETTYLFLSGPCQPKCGGSLTDPKSPVYTNMADTFTKVQVKSDNTWEYIWKTQSLSIDLGEYTIFAASLPNNKSTLTGIPCYSCPDPIVQGCAAWTSANITLKKPEITATISPSSIIIDCCSPNKIILSGTTTGNPEKQAAMWIFGEDKVGDDKWIYKIINVSCDDTYSEVISNDIAVKKLVPGNYTVFVQHPMYNHEFDVIIQPYPMEYGKVFVVGSAPIKWSKLFQIDGTGRLIGKQAIDALKLALDDLRIDDIYLIRQFTVIANNALSANFGASPIVGIAPLTVQFNDLSTGSPYEWAWNFGDGYTSTEQNPSHSYTSAGTYTVSLTITGAGGTSNATKTDYISVTGPTPTPTPTPVPGGDTINLYTGWNFVSTPKTLADGKNTAGVVFGGVDTSGHSIFQYNALTHVWEPMSATSPVDPLNGIWIFSKNVTNVKLTFRNNPLETPPTKQLWQGWNAIGSSEIQTVTAQNALMTVQTAWAKLIGFNGATQSYDATIFNSAPSYQSSVSPTRGYWVFMSSDGIYS